MTAKTIVHPKRATHRGASWFALAMALVLTVGIPLATAHEGAAGEHGHSDGIIHESEPNNTCSEADNMWPGDDVFAGEIDWDYTGPFDTADYWSIGTLQEGQTLSAHFAAGSDRGNELAIWRVVNGSCGDFPVSGACGGNDVGLSYHFDCTATSSGSFAIRVSTDNPGPMQYQFENIEIETEERECEKGLDPIQAFIQCGTLPVPFQISEGARAGTQTEGDSIYYESEPNNTCSDADSMWPGNDVFAGEVDWTYGSPTDTVDYWGIGTLQAGQTFYAHWAAGANNINALQVWTIDGGTCAGPSVTGDCGGQDVGLSYYFTCTATVPAAYYISVYTNNPGVTQYQFEDLDIDGPTTDCEDETDPVEALINCGQLPPVGPIGGIRSPPQPLIRHA